MFLAALSTGVNTYLCCNDSSSDIAPGSLRTGIKSVFECDGYRDLSISICIFTFSITVELY